MAITWEYLGYSGAGEEWYYPPPGCGITQACFYLFAGGGGGSQGRPGQPGNGGGGGAFVCGILPTDESNGQAYTIGGGGAGGSGSPYCGQCGGYSCIADPSYTCCMFACGGKGATVTASGCGGNASNCGATSMAGYSGGQGYCMPAGNVCGGGGGGGASGGGSGNSATSNAGGCGGACLSPCVPKGGNGGRGGACGCNGGAGGLLGGGGSGGSCCGLKVGGKGGDGYAYIAYGTAAPLGMPWRLRNIKLPFVSG